MTTTPRLRTHLHASAILRQAGQDGRSAMLLRKGDPDAGSILVILVERNGSAVVLSQTRTPEGEAAWLRASGATPLEPPELSSYIERQTRFDPDLWVLELDAPDFRPPFEATLL
ncbi:DUF1491 family protein [Acetobacter orientalis]|uniref:DUF1491 family protein n=1 Tax=Acetobacter orientalis TaxID=146474 RepID=UPI0020A3FA1E|nr:DUF1491 family protein [Acetobacter orientalis]MCP1220895.1 DUF1491 family protein [Acetobacter orientalis]